MEGFIPSSLGVTAVSELDNDGKTLSGRRGPPEPYVAVAHCPKHGRVWVIRLADGRKRCEWCEAADALAPTTTSAVPTPTEGGEDE